MLPTRFVRVCIAIFVSREDGQESALPFEAVLARSRDTANPGPRLECIVLAVWMLRLWRNPEERRSPECKDRSSGGSISVVVVEFAGGFGGAVPDSRLRRANFTRDMRVLGALFGMPMFSYHCRARPSAGIRWKGRMYAGSPLSPRTVPQE
jgi:hypothetical protein